LTVGGKSANFGGSVKDTSKPKVESVTSTDYNEITVKFDEAVDARGIVISVAEKYGSKATLNVSLKQIKSATEVVFSSDAQKSSTLYNAEISGVKDFAGNVMDEDKDNTFVGQAMNTNKQSLVSAKADDSVTVTAEFGVKVDKATALDAANYELIEKYGGKTVIPVVSAEMAKDSDGNEIANKVVIGLGADTKSGTLYQLTVKNIGTLYGYALDTDKDDVTFVGVDRDTNKPNAITAASDSNTQITISFSDKNGADKLASDADYTLVSVTDKYGKTALDITFKEIKDNKMIFTTAAQKAATLYEVVVKAGIKDKLGNVSTDELKATFVGSGVADKIKAIKSITDNTKTTGKIRVEFDQKYGQGGLDVASYFIDGGIGYPKKVEAVDNEPTKVDITVAKTSTGKLYELTVKGVSNSDGVAMDADGIKKKFVGLGDAEVTAPKLEGAVPLNYQAAKLLFNMKVKDISGLVNDDGKLTANYVEYGTTTNPTNDFEYGYVDPENEQVLIVYTTTSEALKTGNSNDLFYINVDGIPGIDDDNDEITMAEASSAPADIKVEGVVATSKNTLNILFNQPVRYLGIVGGQGFAYVEIAGSGRGGEDAEIVAARALNSAKDIWEVMIDKNLENKEYDFVIDTSADETYISTLDSTVTIVGLDDDVESVRIAGNASLTEYINDVFAYMTDARTVVVQYPEAMDAATAKTIAYYDVAGANIIEASYDGDKNQTTLIIDADLSGSTADVTIANSSVKNAIGNRFVETDKGADLEVEIAVNSKTPAKVEIKEIKADVSDSKITIKLDTKALTPTGENLDGDDGTLLLDYLKIVVETASGTAELATANISDVDVTGITSPDSTDSEYFTEIVVTITGVTMKENGSGSVKFKTADIVGIKGQPVNTDAAEVVFVQKP
jgi:hypothetical protein